MLVKMKNLTVHVADLTLGHVVLVSKAGTDEN